MKRKPKHFLPNIITLTNMFLGFVAIGLIIKNQPLKAGVAIMIAGMLDVFDGKIARLLGIESKFGMEFDSMGRYSFILCCSINFSVFTLCRWITSILRSADFLYATYVWNNQTS